MKGDFYLWSSVQGEREASKVLPSARDFPPPSGSAHPRTPASGQEDALSSGQHRTSYFWNKAARLSRSEMPSAFWPLPRTVPKHVANGSLKGAAKGSRIFLLLLGNALLQGHLFPRSLDDKGNKVGCSAQQAVRSLAQPCWDHHQNST